MNKKIKIYEKNLIASIVENIKKIDSKNRIISIIITGSFGRNEPTYVIIDDNNYKLKSDIEIALVYKKHSRKKYLNSLIKCVSEKYEEDLNLMSISEIRVRKMQNFNNSLLTSKKKTLFTYDLYNGSYTAYGEKIIENKTVTIDEIDCFEAKRIVANRIAEYCYNLNNLNDEYLKSQWKSKIFLALGTAILLEKKLYKSSYKKQKEIINSIDIELKNSSAFLENYNKSFNFLRENGNLFNANEKKLMNCVKEVYYKFLADKTKVSVNSCSRKIKYIFKYIVNEKKIPNLHFEEDIVDKLILNYINNNTEELKSLSTLWHNTIY